MEDVKWRQQHDGNAGVVAVIANLASNSPSKGGKAVSLAASLSFSDCSGSKLFVEKGYWLDSLANSVDMTVGSTRQVLIGVVDDSYLRVFENRFEEDPRRENGAGKTVYVTTANERTFSDDLDVRIRIYSVETGKIFDTQDLPVPHGPRDRECRKERQKLDQSYLEGALQRSTGLP